MFGLNFAHRLLPDVHTPHYFTEITGEGTHAARPAAEIAGRLYWETDTKILFKDSGTVWVELWRGGIQSHTLASHSTKPHSALTDVNASQHHTKTTPGIVFNLGLAATGTKKTQALIPVSLTVSLVKIYADTAPTGAAIIVDINKNGTTIFTTQGNRPEISINGHSADSGAPDVVSLVAGDRLSVDIDQVGSNEAGGSDLLVVVICL